MATLFDARLNEFQGALDGINGLTLTDARTATNTLNSLNANVVVDIHGKATMFVHLNVTVTFNAATSIQLQGTVDGTNFFQLPFFIVQSTSTGTPAAETCTNILTAVGTGQILVCCSTTGFRQMRVIMSAFTTAGTAVVSVRATQADYRIIAQPSPTLLWVTATAAANTSATATLPAAGAGLFHYITSINLMRNATAALAGTATLIHTTTNLPGSPAWSVGNAMVAGGTQTDVDYQPAQPLKSSVANTATTIVMPAAGAAVLNRINVGYYIGA